MKPSPLTITTCFIVILPTCASGSTISAHPGVHSEVIKQVTEALLSLSNMVQGQRMFKKTPIRKTGAISMKDYASLNKLGLEILYQEQH
ncbi:MAG: phosphate/phosphite/phosphonate ABC transporter substrate-binding protein [Gammaproteobacteria bacterium]|nr:phosphate/phosphite/phosphonate ABC transporter substrate-binding protein [Gammaproteobacteria bacterium]